MQRKMYIDVLKSVAILFMVEVHISAQLSPASISANSLLALVVASIGGLAAPLFIALSGWGVHHSLLKKMNKVDSKNAIIYWVISRTIFLLFCQLIVNLIANHVFNWYTPGVLSLLAICTVLSLPLAKMQTRTKLILLFLIFITPQFNGLFFQMNGNWNYVIGANTALEWLERLFFNGTYPLFPWLSFFVLGNILRDSNKSLNYATMIAGILISSYYIIFSLMTNTKWALTQGDALLTFFPASFAFIVTANTTVLIGFMLLEQCEAKLQKISLMKSFSKIGNLSLTIYLLHFIPLRVLAELGLENWGAIEAIIITILFTLIWWPLSIIHNKWFKKYSVETLLRWFSATKNIPKPSV